MSKTPIIFDCGPGYDDAIALIIALANKEIDVKAITTVWGHSSEENTTQNTLKILELCKKTNIEVGQGASKSFLREVFTGKLVYGESGMEGTLLPEPSIKPSGLQAVNLMSRVVTHSEYPITIVATGPLTNVATFLLSNPTLKSKIDYVSLVGGGLYDGNETYVAESNIWLDPEAAQVVMTSGIPVIFYGLNVTHKALILEEEFEIFRKSNNPISQYVADLLDFYSPYYMRTGDLMGCPMRDLCAIAGVIDPRMFDYEHTKLAVDLDGCVSRGACYIDLRPEPRRNFPYNGKAAIDIDRKKFLELIIESCENIYK